jgi:hypothetical protein
MLVLRERQIWTDIHRAAILVEALERVVVEVAFNAGLIVLRYCRECGAARFAVKDAFPVRTTVSGYLGI